MAIRIVCNRKLELSEDEFQMYKDICRSYDRANSKGEDLFHDLFETDDNGIIVFMRPPSTRYTSMEVVCFVIMIFQTQHMRLLQNKANRIFEEVKEKTNAAIAELKQKS